MRDGDRRPLAQNLGTALVGIGIGLGVLVVGFVVSRIALPDPVVAAATSTPTPSRSAAAIATPTSAPTATRAPTPTPSPSTAPAPSADAIVVSAYQGQGLRLAAITIPAGYTFTTPITGRVSIALYQWVDGQIRTGLDDQPSYPYIFVRSSDREIKLRPGMIDRDIQLLVKDGETVAAGQPLFKTLTAGASSWATFYDSAVKAQVIASAVNVASNQEIDPVPLFKR